MISEKWIVGSEYDEKLFQALKSSLVALGFMLDSKWDAIVGSQDITSWKLVNSKGELTIESETYIGLSVTGTASLVQELKQQFSKHFPNH